VFDWKAALSTIAPVLGTAIGGPFGGMAAKLVTDALGLPDNCSTTEIAAAMEKDPESVLKLKKAEHDFLIKLEEAGIKKEEIAASDRSNARDYSANTGTKVVNRLALFIVCLVIVICIGVGYLFADGKLVALTAMQSSILTLVLREAFAKLEQVCNFFFGSSHGSREKDKIKNR